MGLIPIAKRVERLRLAKSAIAKAAGLHENTVQRALAMAPKSYTSTQTRIDQVVIAEELALRDHLLALHPLPAPAQPEPGR